MAAAFRLGLIADLPDMRGVSALPHADLGRLPPIGFVRTQVLWFPHRGLRSSDDDSVQGGVEQLHVMPIGSADDKRERDPSTVDQQTAFGPFFFPGPSDWVRPLPGRGALCPWCRRYSATPRQSLPSRRIPPNPLARAARKIRRLATAGNGRVWNYHSQSPPAAPSTGSLCAEHIRWRQRFGAR